MSEKNPPMKNADINECLGTLIIFVSLVEYFLDCPLENSKGYSLYLLPIPREFLFLFF